MSRSLHFSLSAFLRFHCHSTTSVINLSGTEYFWRTHKFEPQCYDANDNQVVTYTRKLFDEHPRRQGHLAFSEEIASNPDKLDAILLSFWIFKVCRDVHFPWKRKYVPKLLGAAAASVGAKQPEPKPEAAVVSDSKTAKEEVKPEVKADVQPEATAVEQPEQSKAEKAVTPPAVEGEKTA